MRARTWIALGALAAGAATSAGCAPPAVYVTNAGSASVSQFGAAGGALAPLSPPTVATGANPLGIAVAPNGRNAYVTISEPGAVLRFRIGRRGALSPGASAPIPADAFPGDVAVSPDGRSVYVIKTGGEQSLLQYSVTPGGSLVPKAPATVPTGPGPTRLAISPDSRSVYVTNTISGLNTVSQYTAARDGTLSPKSPATVPAGDTSTAEPIGIAVSPNGRSVYVAAAEADINLPGLLLQYDVAADGTLSPKSPAAVPASANPFIVVVSPNGKSVYVTNQDAAGAVLQYDVGPGGLLSAKASPAVAAGAFPSGLAPSCDGRSLYVANTGDDTISQYAVHRDGSLNARSPATVPAGKSPYAVAVNPADGHRCRFAFRP